MIISIIMLVTGVVLTGGYVTVNRVSGLRVAAAVEEHIFPADASLAHIVVYLDEWLTRLGRGELHFVMGNALYEASLPEVTYHREAVIRIVATIGLVSFYQCRDAEPPIEIDMDGYGNAVMVDIASGNSFYQCRDAEPPIEIDMDWYPDCVGESEAKLLFLKEVFADVSSRHPNLEPPRE